GSHGEFLSLKGTPWSARPSLPAQRLQILRHLSPRRPPAKRVRAWGRITDVGLLTATPSKFALNVGDGDGALRGKTGSGKSEAPSEDRNHHSKQRDPESRQTGNHDGGSGQQRQGCNPIEGSVGCYIHVSLLMSPGRTMRRPS